MEPNSIAWHEQNISNMQRNLTLLVHNRDRLTEEVERELKRLHFYKQQIAEARRKGKLKFDPNRFLVKRKK